jgi:hypothetical protein
MPKYLLTYHGGEFPQALSEQVGAAWSAWMDGLGDAFVDRGGPLDFNRTILAGGMVAADGGANPATGYSVIVADNMDAAVAMAKGCPQTRAPHVDGSIEVAEMLEM